MSDLKSAWEISLQKSDKLNPELKKKKLTQKQKTAIGEIRKEYQAKIADKDLTLQHQIKQLADKVSPQEVELGAEGAKRAFAEGKRLLEEEMERKVEEIRNRNH